VRLFEIANQYRALEALDTSEDIPEDAIRDTLDSLEGDFEVKAVTIAKFILSLEDAADSIAAAAKAMEARAARVNKRAESIKAYLLFQMQAINKKKIETAEIILRRQNNPPAVQITNESGIPAEYWRQPPIPPMIPDKAKLKEALQSGIDIPGAFIESGEHVRIIL
jgi:hypothetical protein